MNKAKIRLSPKEDAIGSECRCDFNKESNPAENQIDAGTSTTKFYRLFKTLS